MYWQQIDNKKKISKRRKNQFCDYHKNVRLWISIGTQVCCLQSIAEQRPRQKKQHEKKKCVPKRNSCVASLRFDSYGSLSFQILFAGCSAQKWLICFFSSLFVSRMSAYIFVFRWGIFATTTQHTMTRWHRLCVNFVHKTISVAFDTSHDVIKYITRNSDHGSNSLRSVHWLFLSFWFFDIFLMGDDRNRIYILILFFETIIGWFPLWNGEKKNLILENSKIIFEIK